MISSSEVGGCCRVQVAWLFPLVALFSPSSFSSSSSSTTFSSSSSRFLPPFRISPLAPMSPLFPPVPLSFSSTPFVLSAILPTSKNSDPTTIAEATHARRSLRACKVVLPSTPSCSQERVDYLWGHPRSRKVYIYICMRFESSISVGILSVFEIYSSSKGNVISADIFPFISMDPLSSVKCYGYFSFTHHESALK